jgi:leucyl-tRNA synthetase
VADPARVAVPVGGTPRATLPLPRHASQEQAEAAARADTNIAKHLDGKTVRKVVWVPGRMVSFVVT